MNRLTRMSATVGSSVALVAGFAGVAGAQPFIGTTGFDSNNVIHRSNVQTYRLQNDNDVRATNNNPQSAYSGRVEAEENTTVGYGGGGGGGAVSSGQAYNNSLNQVKVNLNNSTPSNMGGGAGGGGGSDLSNAAISTTGADSNNRITSTNRLNVNVTNDNDVTVQNNNSQTAVSGNVEAERNTTVGSVSSGAATNVSTNTIEVTTSN